MTINKALKILNTYCNYEREVDEEELRDAAKLGIEAFKRVQDCRKVLCNLGQKQLLGETKE